MFAVVRTEARHRKSIIDEAVEEAPRRGGGGGVLICTCGEMGLMAATLFSVSLVSAGASLADGCAGGVRCGTGVLY